MELQSPLSLILGTNGSGKSSLLEELTPLPSAKSDYPKGGGKDITITHRGDRYRIKSEFDKTAHHSFIKNDEELNPGGTAAIQKQLAETHLGFTQNLHELLRGEATLTRMTPSKRREWITSLSNVDMSYATKVYNSAKTAARDASGALKHAKNRLAKESARLADQVEIEEIRKRVEVLNRDFQILIEEKDNSAQPLTEIERQMAEVRKELTAACDDLSQRHGRGDKFYAKNMDGIIESINQRSLQLTETSTKIQMYTEELERVRGILAKLEEAGGANMESLQGRQTVLLEQMARLPKLSDEFTFDGDPEAAERDTNEVASTLRDFVISIPNDVKPSVSLEEAKVLFAEGEELENKIKSAKAKQQHAFERITHIESSRSSECPKCTYRWIPGVSEGELSKYKDIAEQCQKAIEVHEQRLAKITAIRDEVREFTDTMRRYKAIVESYPRLRPFWAAVIDYDYIVNSPSSITELYQRWMHFITVKRSHITISDELSEVERTMKQLESLQASGGEQPTERVVHLENALEQALTQRERLTAEVKELERKKENMSQYVSRLDRAGLMADRLDKLLNEYFRSMKAEHIQVQLDETTQNLAALQMKLNENDVLLGIVNDIKNSIDDLEIDYEGWKKLTEILSPQTGIIAQQMSGFIEHLCAQMNLVIKKLWEYDLTVMPCGVDSGDLDYKFPLLVSKETRPVADISKGSTGQKEVIDFAFMIVVMFYKDLQDYPMYLDETGANFDAAHRDRLLMYIRSLVDGDQCSQVFLVNHYATFSGGLTNADVCVLDSGNIAVPDSYNQHVSIN